MVVVDSAGGGAGNGERVILNVNKETVNMELNEGTRGNTAKTAFLYLLSLISLGFVTVAGGMVIFQIINKFFTGVGDPYSAYYSVTVLRSALAALIVSAPIYFVTVWRVNKALFAGAIGAEAGIRRWLTYLILLVATVVMIGYLIATINAFLNGKLTTPFVLEILAVLFIAGMTFAYYLYDVKRVDLEGRADGRPRVFAIAAIVAVAAVVGGGLVVNELPAVTRQKRQDEDTVSRLNQTVWAVENYYQQEGKLPDSLDVLTGVRLVESNATNPVSGEKFEYSVVGGKTYELCTTFQLANNEKPAEEDYYSYAYNNQEWLHGEGRQCFTKKVPTDGKLTPLPVR